MAGQRKALFNNSKIHMDEEALAINAKAEENGLLETPPSETNAPEVTSDEVQPEKTDQSTEPQGTEGEKKVSGAEKRIHKLVDERDQARQQAESLSAKLAELTATAQSQPGYTPTNQPPVGESQGELTIDDLRTIARLEVEKERTINRINLEASEAQRAHPELDPNSDKFDPDINEAVTTAVHLEIRNNPSLSVKTLTEKYMKPYRKVAERAIGQEKATITRQVSEEALRPSSVKPVNKSFAEKSIEEMEKELTIVH